VENSRNDLIDDFLKNSGLVNFQRIKIPGDASFRHYERIITPGEKYILMDSPPDKEDVQPFIEIDNILRKLGLSAPEIYDSDIKNGFLLLEDMGDGKFKDILAKYPQREEELYKLAIDVLDKIYDQKNMFRNFGLLPYTREKLMGEAMLFVDWYMALFHRIEGSKKDKIAREYSRLMNLSLDRLELPNDTMVLRDYHADNLMLLEELSGTKKVGLLDFQDALLGNVAYDLISLLEDARRDVSADLQKKMIEYFLSRNSVHVKKDELLNDYNILGAQRNLKIIGIFSRLKVRDGKDTYLPMIPRVKAYLAQDLQHESMKEMQAFLKDIKVI
jgi:aminoglycoside/choline kinase family phosphotransferase